MKVTSGSETSPKRDILNIFDFKFVWCPSLFFLKPRGVVPSPESRVPGKYFDTTGAEIDGGLENKKKGDSKVTE